MKLPQLALRDLFWLVLVAALLLGWWVERSRLQAEVRSLRDEIWSKAPVVEGIVLAVNPKEQLVEISIGSDEGIELHQYLEVYRGRHYVGRIKITAVKPDRCVGRTTWKVGDQDFRKQDKVTTRLDRRLGIDDR